MKLPNSNRKADSTGQSHPGNSKHRGMAEIWGTHGKVEPGARNNLERKHRLRLQRVLNVHMVKLEDGNKKL